MIKMIKKTLRFSVFFNSRGLVFWYLDSFFCEVSNPARGSFKKSPLIEKEKVDRSYTLLAPYSAYNNLNEKGVVYLLDLFGKPVHKWQTQYPPFYATLKKDGNLVVANIFPANLASFPGSAALKELNCITSL